MTLELGRSVRLSLSVALALHVILLLGAGCTTVRPLPIPTRATTAPDEIKPLEGQSASLLLSKIIMGERRHDNR